MKKKNKVTAIQIVGGLQKKRPDPAELLKELKLDTNPEWTFTLFRPHMGGIMYISHSKKKGDKNG